VYFRAQEGKVSYINELELSSGRVRRLVPEPVINSPILSPGGQWIVSTTPSEDPDNTAFTKAYPKNGGVPIKVCQRCFLKWTGDGKWLFISFGFGNVMGGRKTFVVALPPGKAFPTLPAGGVNTEAEAEKLPGVRVINLGFVFPGLTPSVYAYVKQSAQRNLYRIVLR
jgi:hypothetical protein